MRWIFAFIILVHGLIHAMGLVKAFGFAELSQLTQPISRPVGILWLVAGLMTLATVVALFLWPRGYWVLGAAAVVLSQVVILSSWHDAKFGTIANVLLLAGVIYGYLNEGPLSFRAEYDEATTAGLSRSRPPPELLTEADLAKLPDPVARYVKATGFVGKPRVQSYRLRFTGRIRSDPGSAWMPFEADQQSFVEPKVRLFWMRATMKGLPVEAFHHLADGAATMRVKALGAIPLVNASGPVMDRSESVTVLNDMCLLAPGSLLDPSIRWEAVDAHTAIARFTHGAHTVTATLLFGDDGLLTNFISDDRSRSSSDGKSFTQLRFSTPVREYRTFGPYRLAAFGEGRWHTSDGDFAYGEFIIQHVEYNVQPERSAAELSLKPARAY